MKISLFYTFAVALFLSLTAADTRAQEMLGGMVKYREITQYKFDELFAEHAENPRVKDWLARLPKEGEKARVLYFTEAAALYEEDSSAPEVAVSRDLQGALARVSFMQQPSAELVRLHYDFGDKKKTEQIDFMARNFVLEGTLESKPWKLTNKQIKVEDYLCMSAELRQGEDSIVAWFTPQIPIAAGPDRFYGLPGLVLVVEINGETAYMATSVDLTPPHNKSLGKPDEGKKVTPEEFDKIVAEKVKEYQETKAQGRGQRGGDRR